KRRRVGFAGADAMLGGVDDGVYERLEAKSRDFALLYVGPSVGENGGLPALEAQVFQNATGDFRQAQTRFVPAKRREVVLKTRPRKIEHANRSLELEAAGAIARGTQQDPVDAPPVEPALLRALTRDGSESAAHEAALRVKRVVEVEDHGSGARRHGGAPLRRREYAD